MTIGIQQRTKFEGFWFHPLNLKKTQKYSLWNRAPSFLTWNHKHTFSHLWTQLTNLFVVIIKNYYVTETFESLWLHKVGH